MPRKITRLADHLWSNYDVDPQTGCWNYRFCDKVTRRARVKTRGKHFPAARLAYAFHHGLILEEIRGLIIPSCRNPRCINPEHLTVGSPLDLSKVNAAAGVLKGRDQSGEKNANAKLSTKDIDTIKLLIDVGLTNIRIGEIFGVHHSTISLIRRNKAWLPLATETV